MSQAVKLFAAVRAGERAIPKIAALVSDGEYGDVLTGAISDLNARKREVEGAKALAQTRALLAKAGVALVAQGKKSVGQCVAEDEATGWELWLKPEAEEKEPEDPFVVLMKKAQKLADKGDKRAADLLVAYKKLLEASE